jgi:hypothetical protein
MRRTEKTVITIETFQRTVVCTRRTSTAARNEEHADEAGISPDTAEELKRSIQEPALTAKAGEQR